MILDGNSIKGMLKLYCWGDKAFQMESFSLRKRRKLKTLTFFYQREPQKQAKTFEIFQLKLIGSLPSGTSLLLISPKLFLQSLYHKFQCFAAGAYRVESNYA